MNYIQWLRFRPAFSSSRAVVNTGACAVTKRFRSKGSASGITDIFSSAHLARYGYARVSFPDQDCALQEARLRDEGCKVIRERQQAGSKRRKPRGATRGASRPCCWARHPGSHRAGPDCPLSDMGLRRPALWLFDLAGVDHTPARPVSLELVQRRVTREQQRRLIEEARAARRGEQIARPQEHAGITPRLPPQMSQPSRPKNVRES